MPSPNTVRSGWYIAQCETCGKFSPEMCPVPLAIAHDVNTVAALTARNSGGSHHTGNSILREAGFPAAERRGGTCAASLLRRLHV
jgi:hypothetical protein